MKQLISLVLSLVMILGMVPAISIAADAAEYTVVDKVPATLDTSISVSPWGAPVGQWVPMYGTADGQPDSGAFLAWSDTHFAEVVAEGYKDAGALHMKSAASTTAVGINIGMAAGETYTLGMWVKGSTTNANKVLSLYANGDGTIIGTTEYSTDGITASTTISDQWTYVERTFTANLSQLNLWAANWGENDIYIDNITVKNAAGVDLMAGCGDFCVASEVVKDSDVSKQWLDESLFDPTRISGAYEATAGVWTPMYPAGSPDAGTWSAWDDSHYAELSLDGYKDAGSLHMVSAPSKNTGIAINAGMTAGETYTLGLWAKGTAQSQSLFSYGNGDFAIIAGAEDLSAEWQYYEVSFTATMSGFNLCCRDWGSNDVYVDNITLKNSAGVDLLAGYGDFYTDKDPNLTAVAATLDTSKLDDLYGAPTDQWVPFTPWANYQDTWPVWESGVNYGEIVTAGHDDVGALHLVSAGSKNAGVVIDPGMVVGETYTIGMWVKGTAASNKMLALYGNGDPCLIGNPEYCGDVCLTAVPAEWTYIEKSFTATHNSLAIFAADWGVTDIYIDNITLVNSAGVDLLAGNGDFCEYADLSVEIMTIDTSKAVPSYDTADAPSNAWSVMYEIGTPAGTWAEWNSDRPYGEIVEKGHNDIGALHLASDGYKNAGVAINAGMTAGQTYTLGLWAKGTSNSGRVLAMYGNGDTTVIGASAELGSDWTYYEVTFTADRSQFNLFAADWGTTDVYVDNITLKDANGNDLLAGYGDFYKAVTEEPPVEPDDGPNVPTDDVVSGTADAIDTNKHSWDALSHVDAWTPFFPAGVDTDNAGGTNWVQWESNTENENGYNYVEIAAIGKSDAGSLHFVRGDVYEHIGVAIDAGMIPGETYTLKAYVKGYAKATYGGLQLYSNGNGTFATFGADGTVANNSNWTELTFTFTADRTALQLMLNGGAYVSDIYVDDLQLINAAGENILGNKGNFSVVEEDIPDLAVISSEAERAYRWYWNAPGLGGVNMTSSVNNNVEIITEGCEDPGALNIWQNWYTDGREVQDAQDVCLSLITTQAHDRTDGQTYTLSMNVKGVFGNSGELLSIFPAYMNETEAKEQLNITGKLKETLGITCGDYERFYVPEWTNIQFELPYNEGENGFTYLILRMSKYVWGSHFYIDNLKVLDPDGNDVLGGAGNFMDSGSESYPIQLPNHTEVQIHNSGTMYYTGDYHYATVKIANYTESGFTLGDQNFTVIHNGQTYSARQANAGLLMKSQDGKPVVFAVCSTEGILEEDISKLDQLNIYNITVEYHEHSYDEWIVTKPATLTEAGEKQGTCVCGHSVTEEIPCLAGDVEGWSLTLGGDLSVNFKINVHEDIRDTAQIVITVADESFVYNVAELTGSADGTYYVSASVAAAQMGETITVQIVNGDDASVTKTYSVVQYAQTILADESMSSYHQLVKEMLNYGAAAQTYFNYDANDLVNAGITGVGAAEIPADAAAEQKITGEVDGISFYGATLLFQDKVGIRYYFTVSGDIDTYSFVANNVEYEPIQKGDHYYIEVSDINPQDLDNSVLVVVNNEMTVSYCPMNYIVRMSEKGSDSLKALVKAMYNYHLAAEVLCPDTV